MADEKFATLLRAAVERQHAEGELIYRAFTTDLIPAIAQAAGLPRDDVRLYGSAAGRAWLAPLPPNFRGYLDYGKFGFAFVTALRIPGLRTPTSELWIDTTATADSRVIALKFEQGAHLAYKPDGAEAASQRDAIVQSALKCAELHLRQHGLRL
jgi:hypothetical protein